MKEFIEKLIERFEEEYLQAEKDMELSDTCDEASRCGGRAAAYEKAQKIVNQLAEEYNNDVCEWRLCDEEANVYDTTCRNPHILIEGSPTDNNYEYCPYCGKKIKIAPYQPKGE